MDGTAPAGGEHPEALKALRRGWCLGGKSFHRQMLLRLESKLGEHHARQLHLASAEAKAETILTEELKRRGWEEEDLAAKSKGDPDKLEIAARLRRETTLSSRATARRVGLCTSRAATSGCTSICAKAQSPAQVKLSSEYEKASQQNAPYYGLTPLKLKDRFEMLGAKSVGAEVQFLDVGTKFWKSSRTEPAKWKQAVQSGKEPDFGGGFKTHFKRLK